ncbi:MAG: ABC transporter permease [Sphingobacteriales bacterium]|nr:MAG: ABC transporter permease [Sphingobacteriales bacterium]
MFRLNLKIALRNIWKHKLTNAIKLLGLVVGLSTVVLLVVYVMFEFSFDKHNEHVDEIYRVHTVNSKSLQEDIHLPSGLSKMLEDEIPDVANSTMLRSNEVQVKVGDHFFTRHLLTTEAAFFDIFTAPLKQGASLIAPNTAIISESFAKAAFPNGKVLGQRIVVPNYKDGLQVVGIMKDLPKSSHFRADIVAKSDLSQELNWRAYSSIPQYIRLKEGMTAAAVEAKLKDLYKKYNFPENVELKLMPLSKIHLHSHTAGEMGVNGDIKYVYIFAIVAFFILLIAVVNFVNLTIAGSIKRAKEIGVKKVMGASSGQLKRQFLSESYLYFGIATLFVLILTHDLIPFLGLKIGFDLSLDDVLNAKTVLISACIIIFAGFISGLYPAYVLSRAVPVSMLKGYGNSISGSSGFKKVLMTFQFAISAFLIVCTLVIYAQLRFIKNKNLGFDKEQLIVGSFTIFGTGFEGFKQELLKSSDIKSVSLGSFNPGNYYGSSSSWTNDKDTTEYKADFIYADLDFMKTLDINLVAGRSFSSKYGSDMVNYDALAGTLPYEEYNKVKGQQPILLNQAAVKALNLARPLDTVLTYGGLTGKVIGVVSDFNGMSLHQQVTPLVINLSLNSSSGLLYIKARSSDLNTTISGIEQLWKKHFPSISPDLQFMDTRLEKLYQSEMILESTFIFFAGIAIFLCCIGLFGMVYFDLEYRTKEIAVRKILGASVKDLLALLNGSFVKIVLIANLIIWPAAYYLTREWLSSFFYRIELSYVPFVIAMGLCLLLTLLTVSLQALKTLRKSPVTALKYD